MMLNKKIALDYHFSLQEFYQKLSHLPGFVLLESKEHRLGRYDILSAYPYDRLIIKKNTPNKSQLLKQFKKKLSVCNHNADLPFQGGAIGYISYDLGAHLLGIHTPAQPTLKTMPLLDLGLYDWAIIVDHHLKTVVLFAANTQPTTLDIIQEVIRRWHAVDLPLKNKGVLQSSFLPLISKDSYRESFESIHQALKAGRSYQVNYTQPFHAGYDGDAWELYKKVSSKNPVAFAAFIRTKEASILSFSPERFLFYDQGLLLTSPIKGTIARSHDPIEDKRLKKQLRFCSKNLAEHIMIVDLSRNDLGKISCPGSVQVSKLCAIQSYHSLHHMVSDIKSKCLSDLHPFEAFLSCFPGGSITGAPKLEAMKIINEQERYARGVYCGSIGYFSRHGRFDTNIAIRTITAKDQILHLAAGGGIVIDSFWEEEYRECYLKMAAIINEI